MATIMIVAGESSGELYGSLLAKALKSKWSNLQLIGIGGKRMEKEGVELISSTSDAFGILEAVSAYRHVRASFKKAVNAIKKFMPDVLVLIDYPDFNIKLAQVAKEHKIKILYYVSPQVWAWRKGRIKKIAEIVDKMAVILPFEEKIYKEAGVQCEFVGHPIAEEIESVLQLSLPSMSELSSPLPRSLFKTELGLNPDRPLLALLPGSRPSELKRHLPLLLDVVKNSKNEFRVYQFCMPLASNTDEQKYGLQLSLLKKEGVIIKKDESVKVLAASDMAVVTSGTATLQTALLGVPMVVIYKLSLLTYLIGKLLLHIKHVSLVNILAGRDVVTELIQDTANSENIIKELKKFVSDTRYREDILNSYKIIKKPFSSKRPSERVAEMVMEMIGNR
jgi:lipid-A-disaccharide synthase